MPDRPLTRILYVEDEEDIRAVAQVALEKVGGYTVEMCSSGKEALARATAFDPDLILLDVMMPEMDGITVFQNLQSDPTTKNIPVILMTARVLNDDLDRYKSLGVMDVISKPFKPMTLSETLNNIWKQHHE